MEVKSRILQTVTIATWVVLLVTIGLVVYSNTKYERQIGELQNRLAQSAETVEVQKGVYEKLTLEKKHVEDLLNERDEQERLLKEQLEKEKAHALAMTNMALSWKKAYEGKADAHQEPVPDNPDRLKVEFKKDFGYIGVEGHTLTNPAEAWVKVQQNRPLKLSVALSEDSKGQWKVSTTSSEENVGIDIGVSAVNPYHFDAKWYEKIQARLDLGVGDGALAGLSLQYKIGQFDVGPACWVTVSDELQKYVGASLTWYPFQRSR